MLTLFGITSITYGLTLSLRFYFDSIPRINHIIMEYTGLLSFVYLCAVMVTGTRWSFVTSIYENKTKQMLAHKYFAIAAVLLGVVHYVYFNYGRFLFDFSNNQRGQRGLHHAHEQGFSLKMLSHPVGEIALFILIVILVIGLNRRLGFKTLKKFHIISGLAFLLAAFHSIVLLPDRFTYVPVWLLCLLALAPAGYCAVMQITGRLNKKKPQSRLG
ncbi:ferric reductase-like transmembrane domain-containing protein [Polycladidibacter stylochi]|uniref:ferric reductase-like transmembrane domain-containing protein n=1 Tax=Polycladidibacter stylochi TaxID=1807766 RepID=UPI00082B37A2|nr:ferric reductase-like transmembrane domain-containing protein [Pseudovibrio stylochi]